MKEVVQLRMAAWTDMIRQQKESGLSIRAWCMQNNVSQPSYYYRLKQLRKAALEEYTNQSFNVDSEESETSFVRIIPESKKSSEDVALRIQQGNTSIEVHNHASPEILNLIKEVLIYAL